MDELSEAMAGEPERPEPGTALDAGETPADSEMESVATVSDSISGRLERIVESILFAAATPVGLRRLVEILGGPTSKEVQTAIERLKNEYAAGQRGIQLREVAGGYQFRTARENAEWVRAIFREKPSRLGRAALETLAIVAYKQPVTRAEIEAIRGVDVDGVLSTLMARRLIKMAGRKEAVGRPLLYVTAPEFLEVFGLKDLNELPSLKELGPAPDTDDDAVISENQPQSAAAEVTAADTVAADAALAPADAGANDGTLAKDPEPSGDYVAAESRGADPSGAGAPERPGGDGAGDESEPADGSDRG